MIFLALIPLAMLAFAMLALAGVAAIPLGVGAAFVAIKLLFLAVLIGLIGGMLRRRRPPWQPGGWGPGPWSRGGDTPPRPTAEMFEEWHRLAHAREEVDSWAPDTD